MLRAYGVPLEMTGTDVWDVEQGYIIRKDRYYLPEIAFTPEEITALYLAAQSGSATADVVTGVRKLLYGAEGGILTGSGGGPLAMESDTDQDRLMAAAGAASDRHACGSAIARPQGAVVRARRSTRSASSSGRGTGTWWGTITERDAIRAFRLSRVIGRADRRRRRGPSRPKGSSRSTTSTRRRANADRPPVGPGGLHAGGGGPGGGQHRRAHSGSGSATTAGWCFSFPPPTPDTLAPLVLGYGPEAEVLEPQTLRADVIGRRQAVTGG